MGQILPAFPVQPQHTARVTLGDAEFTVRLTWRARTASWYIDLYDADGAELLVGRRVSARGSLWLGMRVPGLPDGELFVSGLDGYARNDLGGKVEIVYYPRAEITPEPADPGFVVRA